MNLQTLIDHLEKHPKDKLLYNSLNVPTWHMAAGGKIVLAGSPCPVQTVEQQIHKLKLVLRRDLPSQDTTFRRVITEDTEIFQATTNTVNGIRYLAAEPISPSTLKLWQIFANDHMAVDVAIGGPSYVLSSDKVKVLVNRDYFEALGVNGKRQYLNELLTINAFATQDGNGEMSFTNKSYWDNSNQHCACEDEPQLLLRTNIGGFSHVNETCNPETEDRSYHG